ncbi:Methyltransferase type 12 domain-containing protein [Nostoc sp. DSM 114161]|jgi:SAM-dependent methyltransferase|uniref:class I SAM-dependent methyltransferase n=1 Tax=Nostoc sp. DSM 114161 TaxID=3440143 RepID=UPI004046535F
MTEKYRKDNGFSQQWDQIYQQNTHMSVWPWSDLVSYIMRYARPNKPEFRVLELGCGAGANIPFFQKLGVEYHAIEGSPAIVGKLREKFPNLENSIVVGDFTKDIPFVDQFDLVVDRSSLTHNATTAIKDSLALVYTKLKIGGRYVGIDWFSTLDSDYQFGIPDEDIYTRRDYTEGHFAHVGRVHFADKPHLEELFAGFAIEVMEHKTVARHIPRDNHILAFWNLVARRV